METLKNLKFYLFYLSQFYLDNLYLLFSDYMEIIYLDNYPGGNPSVGREVMIIICGPDSRRDILFDKIGNDCILVPG